MQIKIYDGKKVLTINEELARGYNALRPKLDIKQAECLLLTSGIDKTTALSDAELSKELSRIMVEEIHVVHDMATGQADKALEIAKNHK